MKQVTYPSRPTVEPLGATLLDVADFAEGIDWLVTNRTHNTEEMFDSYNCMTFQRTAAMCAAAAKTLDQTHPWQSGFWFAVYGGAHCAAPGLDNAEFVSEIERVFRAGESTGVERAFMTTRFVAGPDRDPGAPVDRAWAVPFDATPTPGTPVKPLVGIGILEAYAAAHYVGVPTLHIPRSIATLGFGLGALHWDGKTLRTSMGSKVVAGAGYDYPNNGPTGAAAPAGDKWLYATGEVIVRGGPVIARQVFDPAGNDVYVLAERAYVGVVDCFTAAVLVQETT